jgi:hypothetical protein
MPIGPEGQKRPADSIGNAAKVLRIATKEEPEDYGSSPKSPAVAAGVSDRLWSIEDVPELVAVGDTVAAKRGLYKN